METETLAPAVPAVPSAPTPAAATQAELLPDGRKKAAEYQVFLNMLRRRGLTISSLATTVGCGRSALNRVLLGRRSGSQTWRKLRGVLLANEYDLIARFAASRQKAETSCWQEWQNENKLREQVAALREAARELCDRWRKEAGASRHMHCADCANELEQSLNAI